MNGHGHGHGHGNRHHRHNHHLRLSVPAPSPSLHPSFPFPTPASSSAAAAAAATSLFPSTPSSASTPSKRRHHLSSSSSSSLSFSSLFLLLFSLRSLYSLLPFLRSAPSSFSLFPFSFLVSLLSFSLSLLLPLPSLSSYSSLKPYLPRLASKSALLTLVFLLRFHALRFCPAGAAILADLAGALLAKAVSDAPRRRRRRAAAIRGGAALAAAVVLLSFSWDRVGCFPLSSSSPSPPPPPEGCARVAPMLLPFLSGFLGFFERAATSWGSLRQLGARRVRLYSLGLTTAMLFFPALASFLLQEGDSGAVSFSTLGWPLINTVVFGVILSENYNSDEKVLFSAKDFRRDFAVTFFCTLILELVYFPKLSLPGFLFCGLLLWISVRDLGSSSLNYVELGSSDPSESLYSMIMGPIRHILSERKSRKIAAFLLINTAYMVVEFVAGFMSNSLGLISDACHMLFDCAALAIGLYASYISRLPANSQYNYGRGRFEVLSGYTNAVFLVLVGALIVLESIERILDPQEISTNSLLAVSIGGLVVNIVGLVFFHEEHHHAHGGGSCSHSHAHSHAHSHSHHNHGHHKHGNDGAGHEEKECAEYDKNVTIPYESSDQHSHDSHNHHSCNLGHHHHHHHHHHNLNDEHKNGNTEGCSQEHDHHENNNKHEPHSHSCQRENDEEARATGKPINDSRKHRHIDHNMQGIFLHVLADTMGSVGVRVPRAQEQDLKVALDNIRGIEGVCGITNMHVWNFTNTDIVGTFHLHVSAEADKASAHERASELLHEAGIKDLTIQVEHRNKHTAFIIRKASLKQHAPMKRNFEVQDNLFSPRQKKSPEEWIFIRK
ncbi:Metal tolerance protein 12 [Ananas comosus]|uniref:Metal tolerance protein 12 n=1 Tax=Ananas comosus TaxID=4615 RepID=A0A199W3V1_ANACO|nr:Metal tolerance protein 12 [Ananas comosus]